MRVLLGEEEFDLLTSGKILKKDGVEIALSDIGYARMIDILSEKLEKLYVQ